MIEKHKQYIYWTNPFPSINQNNFNWKSVGANAFFCPDKKIVSVWEEYLGLIRKKGLSVGATIRVNAEGLPAGIGEPIYGKLDTDLAAAMMSINAVKGVEIGDGMAVAELTGEANADEISMGTNGPEYSSNHAGGILGGISTGQDLVVHFLLSLLLQS